MTPMTYVQPAMIAPSRVALTDYGRALGLTGGNAQRPKSTMAIGSEGSRSRPYCLEAGIAVIGVHGILLPKFPYIGWSFATGYDALEYQLGMAFADPDVKGIVLDIDSGGGAVSGCFDLVDYIDGAKRESGKPVVAILSDMACSAAYAIAATADSISVPQTGYVGSVGVVMLHADCSKMYQDFGISLTYIYAGSHKVDGNSVTPLPEDVRDAWQAECEELRQLFAQKVARGRATAGSKITVGDILATEAHVYSGPKGLAQAVKIGLADAVLAPREAFALVAQAVSSEAAA